MESRNVDLLKILMTWLEGPSIKEPLLLGVDGETDKEG
jgi:hypothetical protein